MTEYLKVLRLDHWLKNVFIFFGHLVAIALVPAEVPRGEVGAWVADCFVARSRLLDCLGKLHHQRNS